LARTKVHHIQLSTDFNIGYQEHRKCFDSIVKKKNMHTLILATKNRLKNIDNIHKLIIQTHISLSIL